MLPSDYEEHLTEHPDKVQAILQSHIRGPHGQCVECRRCWPCRPYTSAEIAHHLILAPKTAPPPPPQERAPLAPPAPGRTQLIRTSVDGNRQWVVIAVGTIEA
jgi:5-methylcytosine-specific restriction endonuclease McrA